jgi:predicted transcriptional regulator
MLQQRTKAEKGNLNRALRTLKAKELIIRNGDLYALTDRGRDEFA